VTPARDPETGPVPAPGRALSPQPPPTTGAEGSAAGPDDCHAQDPGTTDPGDPARTSGPAAASRRLPTPRQQQIIDRNLARAGRLSDEKIAALRGLLPIPRRPADD